jgi:hypothetical protein
MAPAFFRCPRCAEWQGRRRTPLCGASQKRWLPLNRRRQRWRLGGQTAEARATLLAALADALAGYAEHFAA